MGVLVLLAAGAANGDTLKVGIAGDKYLKPYGIVILFMSQVGASETLHLECPCAAANAQATDSAGQPDLHAAGMGSCSVRSQICLTELCAASCRRTCAHRWMPLGCLLTSPRRSPAKLAPAATKWCGL